MAIPKRDHKMPTFSTYGDAKVEISGSEKCQFQRESTKCLLLAHVEMKSCVSEGPKLIISKRNLEKALFCHMWSIKGYAFNGRSDPPSLSPLFWHFYVGKFDKTPCFGASAYCNQKER